MGIWPFCKKKKLSETCFFTGFTDWHSHILPGVDDGVKTMEEAMTILDIYGKAGADTVWCTPHIMEDMPNTTASLKERFGELKAAYKGPVKLHLAAEYMMDTLFEERLESGDLLPLGTEGGHLLVETSCYNPPINLFSIIARIKSKGYFPVLAHPERYRYMDTEQYQALLEEGVLFQLNLPSLSGYYGQEAREKAMEFLKRGYYRYIGCDLHRQHTLERLTGTVLNAGTIDTLEKIKKS